jgi:tetratricopeptide (TPR) repeat protein
MWWSQLLLREHRHALAHAHRFLRLSQQIGDFYGVASAWDAVGQTLARLGKHPAAVSCFGRAVDLFERLDEPLGRAYGLRRIGQSADLIGRHG